MQYYSILRRAVHSSEYLELTMASELLNAEGMTVYHLFL